MPQLVFVDTETTHIDPKHGEVYEISLLKPVSDLDLDDFESKDFWIEPTQLHRASGSALQIGRFYERRHKIEDREVGALVKTEELRIESAFEIARFTEGCHLVGAKPDFDAGFLDVFLRQNGACPAWHHRLIDVESLAIGILIGEGDDWGRPQSLSWICEELEIPRETHTARADAEAVLAAYAKLMKIAENLANIGSQA